MSKSPLAAMSNDRYPAGVRYPMWRKALNRHLAAVCAVWWIPTAKATHTASKINARRSSPREPLASSLHGAPQENAPPAHAMPRAKIIPFAAKGICLDMKPTLAHQMRNVRGAKSAISGLTKTSFWEGTGQSKNHNELSASYFIWSTYLKKIDLHL